MDKNFLKYLMKKKKVLWRVLPSSIESLEKEHLKSGIWSKPTWDQNWALKPLCIEN